MLNCVVHWCSLLTESQSPQRSPVLNYCQIITCIPDCCKRVCDCTISNQSTRLGIPIIYTNFGVQYPTIVHGGLDEGRLGCQDFFYQKKDHFSFNKNILNQC